MELLPILLLAILQGLTEFLPISSSAHLILLPRIVGWVDQGLAFDVAVHVGTLSAVILYLRHEIVAIARAWFRSLRSGQHTDNSRLAWAVIIGTLPAGFAGLMLNEIVETSLRSPVVIAIATIAFGLLLWWADDRGKRARIEQSLGWKDALIIGFAQALALIPGTSRSGITITAGLMRGLTRPAAARFSFLLSIPIILAAGMLKGVELTQQTAAVDWRALMLGAVISGLSAYLCIHFFLKLLERMGMLPFVVYRLLLGGVLLLFL